MSIQWSQKVHSNALDLPKGIFTWTDPKKIARALKQASDTSQRTKGTKFASAMRMLTFYINRAGTNLKSEQRQVLQQAKQELRVLYNRPIIYKR